MFLRCSQLFSQFPQIFLDFYVSSGRKPRPEAMTVAWPVWIVSSMANLDNAWTGAQLHNEPVDGQQQPYRLMVKHGKTFHFQTHPCFFLEGQETGPISVPAVTRAALF